MTRSRSAQAGFTLIEVLAALVVVSLGMLGVIQAVSQTASNSTYLRDKTLAHWIAMNRITEVRLAPTPPEVDESSDEIDYAGRRWRWTMNVSQTPVESMRRIDVRVALAGTDERYSLAMVTGFYGTAIAPAGSTLVMWDATPDRPGGLGGNDEQNPDPGTGGQPDDANQNGGADRPDPVNGPGT